MVLETLILIGAVMGSLMVASNKDRLPFWGFVCYVQANAVGVIYFGYTERWILLATYAAFFISSVWGVWNHCRKPGPYAGMKPYVPDRLNFSDPIDRAMLEAFGVVGIRYEPEQKGFRSISIPERATVTFACGHHYTIRANQSLGGCPYGCPKTPLRPHQPPKRPQETGQ